MDHIVLVTYGLNQGGTDRVAGQMACGLAQVGYSTTLLCCTSTGCLDTQICGTLSGGVKRVALSNIQAKSRARGKLRTIFTAWRWMAANRPDAVMATGNNIARFTGVAVALAGSPRPRLYIKVTNPIIREHDTPFKAAIRKLTYGVLFRYADGVFTLSDAQTRLLQQQFPKAANRFRAVDNPYLSAEFETLSSDVKARGQGNMLSILAAGRFAAQKNFGRLLRAYALALKELPAGMDTRLQIAGDGDDRAALEALAQDLGIAQNIEFLGFRQDIAALMSQSDLFVLSSDYEGLPAVVVEALASDCPVISTDCFPNARDLLSGLPGCAVAARDDAALGYAIAQAVTEQYETGGTRPSLREHALRYSTAASVQSHLRAMQVSPTDVLFTPATASG